MESETRLVAGFSGGKDSTAMIIRMHELGWEFDVMTTRTGNDFPELYAHQDRVMQHIGRKLTIVPSFTLHELVKQYRALPNARMRWCTRVLKIEPCLAYLKAYLDGGTHPILCVGLRADEEARQGLYSELVTTRFPMQEWGWDKADVTDFCKAKGLEPPKRTDCMFCFAQRLKEWWALWKYHPEQWAEAKRLEAWVTEERTKGRDDLKEKWYTFRSASRDTWPAALKDLEKEFESGRMPRGVLDDHQGTLFEEDDDYEGACRVCTL